MIKRSICLLLAALMLAVSAAPACVCAEEPFRAFRILVTWTDADGQEQGEVYMPEEGSAVYRAELPGSVLPELQIFASPADVPEEEPEWTPVTAEKETLADGTAV